MNGVVEMNKRKNDLDVGKLEDGDAGKLGEGMDSVKYGNIRLPLHNDVFQGSVAPGAISRV